MGTHLNDKVWSCNVHPRDIKTVAHNALPFWKDVLTAWYSFSYDKCSSAMDQVIWRNSFIRVGNRPIEWVNAIKAGLIWLSQLYESNELISMEQACERYNLNFVQYHSIIAVIPQQWKDELSTTRMRPPHTVYHQLMNKKKVSAHIYCETTEESQVIENLLNRWQKEIPVNRESLQEAFRAIYVTSNSPKLRSFQYRLVHRAIITNTKLYQWKKVDSPNCTFCLKYPESYTHLFCECEMVKPLWKQIYLFHKEITGDEPVIDLSNINIMLNRIVVKRSDVCNLLCLIIKQYVYKQRCLNFKLSEHEVRQIFRKYKNIELYIAQKNNNLVKHKRKWKCT